MSRPTIRAQVPKQDECLIDHLKQRILLNSPSDILWLSSNNLSDRKI